MCFGPLHERPPELGTVVRAQRLRQRALPGNAFDDAHGRAEVMFVSNSMCTPRGWFVNEIEDAERPATGRRIEHGIGRPHHVRVLEQLQPLALALGQPLLHSSPQVEFHLAVHPVDALVVRLGGLSSARQHLSKLRQGAASTRRTRNACMARWQSSISGAFSPSLTAGMESRAIDGPGAKVAYSTMPTGDQLMAKSNPTRPNSPGDEARIGDASTPAVSEHGGPPLKDPRSRASLDNIGDDDQANLLDPELDEQPGDRDAAGHSFADDVRSDMGVGAGIRESGDT